MAYAAVSKTVVFTDVRVQLPPPALLFLSLGFFLIFCPAMLFAEMGVSSSPSMEAPATNDNQTILLQDGTKIKGHLIGVQGDAYIVHTPSLGNISIKSSHVVSITTQEGAANLSPANPTSIPFLESSLGTPSFKNEVTDIQKTMLSDPEIMTALQELAKDPQFLQIINDPEFMAAIMNYDAEKIKDNPRSQLLMQNPTIQNLINKIKQKYP